MSPWLIVTLGWPAGPATLAAVLNRVAANPTADAIVVTAIPATVGVVLLGCRVRLRPRRRSTS